MSQLNRWISAASLGVAITTTIGAIFAVTAKLGRDEAVASADRTARERYENNCIQFKDPNGKPIAINPNSDYRDASGRQFAPGTPICDSFGATAVIGDDGESPIDLAVVSDWTKYRQEKGERVFDFQTRHEVTYRNDNRGR